MNLSVPDISCKWNHTICGLLWLDSFTYMMMFTRFFRVSVLHSFLFSCMDLPHHLDIRIVSSLGLLCYWEYLCAGFCVFSFYLGTHLGVESLPTLTVWCSDYNPCAHWCLSVRIGDGQGGLACCNSWGRRVRHDWATELNWETSDVEHFLMCWLAIHTYRPFTEKFMQNVSPFLNGAIYLWNCWLVFFIYF